MIFPHCPAPLAGLFHVLMTSVAPDINTHKGLNYHSGCLDFPRVFDWPMSIHLNIASEANESDVY